MSNPTGYKIVLVSWVLFLFEPARLVSHYFPSLGPLRWLPTLIVLYAAWLWANSKGEKDSYKWFLVFLLVNVFGTFIAFIDGNWGIARQINRQVFQFYVLGIGTLLFFNDAKKVSNLFLLYFLYILYFALWGIVGLKLDPLEAYSNPGSRPIVAWHPQLDNRDGFGPLMVIGIGYSFYYYRSVSSAKLRKLSLVCLGLCLAGVIISFGRGVFLAAVSIMVFIWLNSKRKVAGLFLLGLFSVGMLLTSSVLTPGHNYWETMKTIGEGTSTESGSDRMVLWGWAWEQFTHNPIFGVGTGNFGIAIFKYVSPEEMLEYGYTEGRIWGRALHSVPMTVLSENGLVGVLAFALLSIDFLRTNKVIRRISREPGGGQPSIKMTEEIGPQRMNYYYMSLGLLACFISYWINGIFYEILYYPFLYSIVVMNRLINVHLQGRKRQTTFC